MPPPHQSEPSHRHAKRFALAGTVIVALLLSGLVPLSSGDLQTQIAAHKSAAAALRSKITADTTQIEQTANGIDSAKHRLWVVQGQLEAHIAQLRTVQTNLMNARDHLEVLEQRLKAASIALADNLRATYENGSPDLVSVILNANGFSNLLEQVNFLRRMGHQDAQIVGFTRTARRQVLRETILLGNLEERDRNLTDQILRQRNQVAALESALLGQRIDEIQARTGARARLASVNTQLGSLQHRLNVIEARAAAAAVQTGLQVNQAVGGLAINTGGMVQPPPGAPAAVSQMIAAGNAIATLPYIWGGGHGSFISPGYDCSGSVSYVLAAAGLLGAPEVSGDFESYGDPGPGRWVTIYANSGHVWMDIAGWRFDTVALAESGTRWSQGGGEYGGFVVRHPPGM
jgi:peptidoglycan hydrolase CwlO-like protein